MAEKILNWIIDNFIFVLFMIFVLILPYQYTKEVLKENSLLITVGVYCLSSLLLLEDKLNRQKEILEKINKNENQ